MKEIKQMNELELFALGKECLDYEFVVLDEIPEDSLLMRYSNAFYPDDISGIKKTITKTYREMATRSLVETKRKIQERERDYAKKHPF